MRCLVIAFIYVSLLGHTTAQDVDFPAILERCIDPLVSPRQQQYCSNEYIANFINEKLVYPDSARERQKEGLVVVRFTIDTLGELTQLELVRNIGYNCGQEALKIVRQLPKFRPAQKDGHPVNSKLNIPIRFRTLDSNPNNANSLYRLQWSTAYGKVLKIDYLEQYARQALTIRDHYGEIYPIERLEMSYIYKRKVITVKGNSPTLTNDMRKLIQKARSKGAITFTAQFKKGRETIDVYREFDLVP